MKKLCVLLLLISTNLVLKGQCDKKICLEYIKIIESAGDSLAINLTDGGSRGLYQISPTCLKTYNLLTNHNYTLDDLYKVKVNTEIARWMVDVEIPYLLKRCKLQNTLDNQIITYNAGIAFLYYNWKIPKSTIAYINKYKKLIKKK